MRSVHLSSQISRITACVLFYILTGVECYFPTYTTLATTEHDLGSRAESHCGREHDRGQSYVIVGDRARSYDDRTGA